MNPAPTYLELEAMVNVRDLGGWPTADGGRTAYGRVWRGDSPARATATDLDLLAAHGVRTVVDLRTAGEREREPNPLERDARFRVHHVDLMAPLLDASPSRPRLGDPFDLETQYRALLRDSAEGIELALGHLRTATDAGEGALLHCTAGKDRTGVVTALLFAAVGTPSDVIADEYALTDARIEPLRPRLLEGAERHGVPRASYARLLTAEAATLRAVLDDLPAGLVAAARGILRAG